MRPTARARALSLWLALTAPAWLPARARAQEPPAAEVPAPNEDLTGFSPSQPTPAIELGGYLDVGFADAGGDGTSFHPDDRRLPIDYAVDPFAPAVNARGDAASIDSGGRFTNGFLPRSAGIGGRPSFLINTASLDIRHGHPTGPLLVFARVQLLPRLEPQGSTTRVVLEQAYGRFSPFSSEELFLFAGRFDSVFGIEYLEKEAPLRVGVTPSLFARYTTGSVIGAKVFYRRQIAPLWSALSLNAAASNGAPFAEVLQPSEVSLTGRPVLTARLGYELNLPAFQAKVGVSWLRGPRNDQGDPSARQRATALDLRLSFLGVSLSGEVLDLQLDPGPAAGKVTGAGPQFLASGFAAEGFWGQLAYAPPFSGDVFRRLTAFGRFERRQARFRGFTPIEVRRLTTGIRLDLGDSVAFKAEVLLNRESAGAPDVNNDLRTASLIWMF
jgi:hypothetical protein